MQLGEGRQEKKINQFAQQENRKHSGVCSKIDVVVEAGRRERGCREKIKGATDRKHVKMSVASLKDSGTAVARAAVRQQVNTNSASTSLF